MAVVLEVTPPRKRSPAILLRRARVLEGCADAVNVIQRPGRISSLEACRMLREAGIEAVFNLVNRGRTREEIQGEIDLAAESGVRGVLCVRGDRSGAGADRADTPAIREVVARVREAMPDGAVGATLNPYAPRRPVIRNLLAKLRAGADFVQTQPVFSLERLRPFAEEVREQVPGVRILSMVMPLLSREIADRLQRRLSIPIPERLLAELGRRGEEAGWEAFEETLAELRASPMVDGIALMTTSMDTPPEVARRLVDTVRRMRVERHS